MILLSKIYKKCKKQKFVILLIIEIAKVIAVVILQLMSSKNSAKGENHDKTNQEKFMERALYFLGTNCSLVLAGTTRNLERHIQSACRQQNTKLFSNGTTTIYLHFSLDCIFIFHCKYAVSKKYKVAQNYFDGSFRRVFNCHLCCSCDGCN